MEQSGCYISWPREASGHWKMFLETIGVLKKGDLRMLQKMLITISWFFRCCFSFWLLSLISVAHAQLTTIKSTFFKNAKLLGGSKQPQIEIQYFNRRVGSPCLSPIVLWVIMHIASYPQKNLFKTARSENWEFFLYLGNQLKTCLQ